MNINHTDITTRPLIATRRLLKAQTTKDNQLSLVELRVLYYAFLKQRENGDSIETAKPVVITAKEYANLFNTSLSNAYRQLDKVLNDLKHKQFDYLNLDDEWVQGIAWTENLKRDIDVSGLIITLSQDVLANILRVHGKEGDGYSQLAMPTLCQFTSLHAFRLYGVLATSVWSSHKPITVHHTFKELQALFGTSYSNSYNFIQRVLLPAVKQINEYSELFVKFGDFMKASDKTFIFALHKKAPAIIKKLHNDWQNDYASRVNKVSDIRYYNDIDLPLTAGLYNETKAPKQPCPTPQKTSPILQQESTPATPKPQSDKQPQGNQTVVVQPNSELEQLMQLGCDEMTAKRMLAQRQNNGRKNSLEQDLITLQKRIDELNQKGIAIDFKTYASVMVKYGWICPTGDWYSSQLEKEFLNYDFYVNSGLHKLPQTPKIIAFNWACEYYNSGLDIWLKPDAPSAIAEEAFKIAVDKYNFNPRGNISHASLFKIYSDCYEQASLDGDKLVKTHHARLKPKQETVVMSDEEHKQVDNMLAQLRNKLSQNKNNDDFLKFI